MLSKSYSKWRSLTSEQKLRKVVHLNKPHHDLEISIYKQTPGRYDILHYIEGLNVENEGQRLKSKR